MNDFLNKAINRKTYVQFFLLGLALTPVIFVASIMGALALKDAAVDQRLILAIPVLAMVVVGMYFYVLKIKRLKDLNRSDREIYEAQHVPFGDFVLMYMLLFKKSGESKHKTNTQTTPVVILQRIGLYLFFFFVIYFLILFYAQTQRFEVLSFADIISTPFSFKTVLFLTLYFCLPYFSALYVWRYLQTWKSS